MYKNYGDVNFFEYGRMAELQYNGTINVLVCNPVYDCQDSDRCYQFDHVNVNINDSWIDVNAVCSYADINKDDIFQSAVCSCTTIKKDDIIRFALACVDYYGVENFGGTCYYNKSQFYTKNEILDNLKYYDIEEV